MLNLDATHDADETDTLLPTILPQCATPSNYSDFAAVCPSFEHDKAEIDLHVNFADHSELKIAKALARHFVEIGSPKCYDPNHLVHRASSEENNFSECLVQN